MNKSYSVRVQEAFGGGRLRFFEVIAAVALLIVVLIVQSTLGIDSLLSAVAGALTYAIVRHFVGKGKETGRS